ncbi:transglutaminase-like cysteine peptidase [Brevundimonas aurifodinae]|uniref:Transglutaminase-like cysteine peptidase n=2 Tax=Brevundimonas TaxID=41275 RepID=A0ABV1NJD9_9CAUL|nr:MAG: hypothetical protein B7Z42_03210 [Brevundimonas sp. 12-68-7]OYX34747.1 MAG: hypothetical protein B7Z01_04170 [Brevundimonas subvibrioides]
MVRKRRPGKFEAIVLASALGVACGATAAVAQTASAPGAVMPLGRAAPAPEGFLDLCERAPDQCPSIGPVPDGRALRAEANRRFWQAAVPRRAGPAAISPAAFTVAPPAVVDFRLVLPVPRLYPLDAALPLDAPSPETAPALDGAPSVEMVATTAVEVAGSAMSPEAAAAGDAITISPDLALAAPPVAEVAPATFALDRAGWRLVNGVNRRMNRGIRNASDARLYGREDHWTLPTGDQAQGDCEDYVLAKRAGLIAAGVPAEALSIAIVETAWGESHAVLLLASDQGEYVLDSLSPWVSRWDRVNYRWRERQAPGRPFDWVSVAL